MDTKTLTLKTPSLHWNNSEIGAKEVNIFVSASVIWNFKVIITPYFRYIWLKFPLGYGLHKRKSVFVIDDCWDKSIDQKSDLE